MTFDEEMMKALEKDAAILESLGADPQPLAFESHAVGMRLTDAANGLWEVYDIHGNILGCNLSVEDADKMLSERS